MKKILIVFIAVVMVLLSSCGIKDAVQNKTREILGMEPVSSGDNGSGAGKTGGNSSGSSYDDEFDVEFTIMVGSSKNWTPFMSDGTVFETDKEKIISIEDNGRAVTFHGLSVGDAVITSILDGAEKKALVKVRTGGSGDLWQLTIKEVTVLDMMGLAVVTYDLDMMAIHEGPDMLGLYTGGLAMNYDANLDGMVELLEASGGSVDYETNGWFVNDAFKMEIMAYDSGSVDAFISSINTETSEEDPATQAMIDAYLEDMFAGIGGGEKDFETAQDPKGLWYDWAFHMTDGDMSAFLNMTGISMGMVSGGVSQDAQGNTSQGYVDVAGLAIGGHVIVSPTHESFDYTQETPFPYFIEVYESGDAVFTLCAPNSPITVKFYGKVERI